MDDIYIKTNELNCWVANYFDKDLISVSELIGVIEDLDSEINILKEKYNELDNDYYEYRQSNPSRY